MIQINLLDQSTGRKQRSSGFNPRKSGSSSGPGAGSLILSLAIFLMAGLCGSLGWTCYAKVHQAGEEYRELQRQVDGFKLKIEATKSKSQQVQEYRKVIENQLDVLNSLDPPHRILWCEKINMLANLVPNDVFISEINVNEKVNMVETHHSKADRDQWAKTDVKKRGKEPEKVMKPVIRYDFQVTGLALGQDNVEQFDNVLKFQKAVAEYKLTEANGSVHRFMDGFEKDIDFKSVESTLHEGVPVNQFIFQLTTTPMGADTVKTEGQKPPIRLAQR